MLRKKTVEIYEKVTDNSFKKGNIVTENEK